MGCRTGIGIDTGGTYTAGTDIYNLRVSRLVKEGVVQICGLTPTDIMHIRGDFSAHSAEAALLGARYAALIS